MPQRVEVPAVDFVNDGRDGAGGVDDGVGLAGEKASNVGEDIPPEPPRADRRTKSLLEGDQLHDRLGQFLQEDGPAGSLVVTLHGLVR